MQIAHFYLWILRWFTVSFSCFWVPFDFLLINQTHTWLCTFTLTSVPSKLLYVAPSCYLKCPCHPMFIPQSCISNIFFRDIWLKLWLNFRRSSSHSSAAKGRQEKRSWVWRLELYLSQRLCLYDVQEIFQISVSHNGEVSPWKWWAKIKNTSTGIAMDCGYLAQSWIFAPGTGFHKDAAKKTGGLSEFIIRLLRDVWPVRQHQSVALKFETCWSEMLQCLDALYSGETKNAEPSVFNMPLRTGNTWERLVSTGVILASSHESIGEKSRHQLGSGPAAGSFCAQECAEGGWIGYIYIYVYIYIIH